MARRDNTTISKITKVYVRTYRDNGQVTAYVEWIDGVGRPGCTEGREDNLHMAALIARGRREGVELVREVW